MHIWWGDERCVAHHDPDSNYFMANEVVLKQLYSNGGDRRCLSPEFVHPMSCAANQPTSHRSPLCYQAQLEKLAASSLDLIHLGMGIDGHTASLFPDSEALEASPDVLVTFNRDPHNNSPHMRMTLTLSAIAKAKLAIVTVMGKDKHNTLKKLVNGANLPAGRIRAEKVVWIVDHDAAQDIDKF
jgi:6-phosphogluconolactonase